MTEDDKKAAAQELALKLVANTKAEEARKAALAKASEAQAKRRTDEKDKRDIQREAQRIAAEMIAEEARRHEPAR